MTLRIYVRHRMMHAMQMDDWLSIVALISFTVSLAFYIAALQHGWGNHMGPEPDLQRLSHAVKWFSLSEVVLIPSNVIIKVSLGFTLLRIVRRKLHIWTLYVCVFITIAMGLALEILIISACRPFSYWWRQFTDPTGELGHCMTFAVQTNASYAHGSIVLVVDIVLGIILPIHLLNALKMRLRTKVTAGVLLSVGSIASIGTIIRLVYSPSVATEDISFTLNRVYFWVVIETGAAIFCACASTWKPLLVHFRILDDSNTGSYSHQKPANLKSWHRRGTSDDIELRTPVHGKRPSTDNSISLEDPPRNDNKISGITRTTQFETVYDRRSTSSPTSPKEVWEPTPQLKSSWLAE